MKLYTEPWNWQTWVYSNEISGMGMGMGHTCKMRNAYKILGKI
jgi:hypothetical protein